MASTVIDTRGMSSTSHNGYVSFNSSSGSSSRGSSSGNVITSLGSPTGIMSSPFSVSNARNLKEDKLYNDLSLDKSASNGLSFSDLSSVLSSLTGINSQSKLENTQQARENAEVQYGLNAGLMRLQHRLNENSAEKVMKFNAIESEKNRQFQERLANTAHVREIEDLKNAGLNPVLSGLGGQGAYTPAGSEAQGHNAQTGLGQVSSIPTDMTNNASIFSNIFDTFMNNVVKERIEDKKIGMQEAIEEAYNDTLRDTTTVGSLINAGGKLLSSIIGYFGWSSAFGNKNSGNKRSKGGAGSR